jgi:hypothetical protein
MEPNSVYRLHVRSNRGPLAKLLKITRGKQGVEDIRAAFDGDEVTGFEVHRTDGRMFVVNMPLVAAFEYDPPSASLQ